MPNKKENKLVLYKDDEGKLSVNTLFADEDVWLTQAQLAEIYKSSKSNISEHLKNIFNDNELDKEVVVRKFRTTTQHGAIEGKTQTHEVLHYNLDVIIALGYRVQSPIAVRFRRWAHPQYRMQWCRQSYGVQRPARNAYRRHHAQGYSHHSQEGCRVYQL